MHFLHIIWSEEDDGNIQHIDEHDLTVDDVEYVLLNASEEDVSKSSGRPCVFGYTPSDEYIMIVFEWIDDSTILPVTAYQVPEP